jgi:hypothetical protein
VLTEASKTKQRRIRIEEEGEEEAAKLGFRLF